VAAIDGNPTTDLTLAGLVHDLNNVFETISEAADLASADPQWNSLMAAIQRSVDRGRRIVDSYVDQSRSGPELELVVDRAATFLKDFLVHLPGIKVKVHHKSLDGLQLSGSTSDWERVFMNLFLNAAQAMKETGGGEIDVDAKATQTEVLVRVSDNGPGIPEAILGKIFKARFSTKNKQGGLGLHIVHTIVQQNGGSVEASNRQDGHGAVFSIRVPLCTPQND
jgi:signal transduction histidine kinase